MDYDLTFYHADYMKMLNNYSLQLALHLQLQACLVKVENCRAMYDIFMIYISHVRVSLSLEDIWGGSRESFIFQ